MRRRIERSVLLWAPVIGALLVLVVHPVARLLALSVRDAQTGRFTLQNYLIVGGGRLYLEALGNSLIMGLAVAVIGLLVGAPMAWAVSRTDMPAKGLVWAATLGSFAMPSYLSAVAWILLAGPGSGWLNRLYTAVTGAAAGPFDVFSMPGLVLVIVCSSFPYAFVFMRSALDGVSAEMEEAAHTLGAGVLRTACRVTLPLVVPAILGAMVVEFLEAIALIGAPALIARPGGFPVATTVLWQLSGLAPASQAAAGATVLLGIAALLAGLRRWVAGWPGGAARTGDGGARRLLRLGRWRWAVLAYCLAVTSLAFFLPMLAVLQAAFAKAWSRGVALDNLTLANLRSVLVEQPATRTATLHTLAYGGLATAIAMALALGIAYGVNRRPVPFGRAVSTLAMAPAAVPGVVLALGFLAAYSAPPLALSGTAWILILAFVTRFLPIAYAESDAALRGIAPALEDAASLLGGGRLAALRQIVVPLARRGVAAGFVLVFIPATRELSSAIFLSSTGTRVLPVLLLDPAAEGHLEYLASIGLVLAGITAALALAGFPLVGRDVLLRRETA